MYVDGNYGTLTSSCRLQMKQNNFTKWYIWSASQIFPPPSRLLSVFFSNVLCTRRRAQSRHMGKNQARTKKADVPPPERKHCLTIIQRRRRSYNLILFSQKHNLKLQVLQSSRSSMCSTSRVTPINNVKHEEDMEMRLSERAMLAPGVG